jgi:hypothetical protein
MELTTSRILLEFAFRLLQLELQPVQLLAQPRGRLLRRIPVHLQVVLNVAFRQRVHDFCCQLRVLRIERNSHQAAALYGLDHQAVLKSAQHLLFMRGVVRKLSCPADSFKERCQIQTPLVAVEFPPLI